MYWLSWAVVRRNPLAGVEPCWGSRLTKIIRLGSPATVLVSLYVLSRSFNRRSVFSFLAFLLPGSCICWLLMMLLGDRSEYDYMELSVHHLMRSDSWRSTARLDYLNIMWICVCLLA
jgi:hypothetical protein